MFFSSPSPRRFLSRFRPGYRTLAGALAAALLFSACGHIGNKAPAVSSRYAIVGFENLSGDAGLDWVARGAASFLSRSLREAMDTPKDPAAIVLGEDTVERANQSLGSPSAGAPGSSSARDGAIAAGANRIVSGYIERTPKGVRITASEEDVATHRTVRTLSATAASPFEALTELSKQFSPKADSSGTENAEAFRLFCTALGQNPAAATPLLEHAVALDPSYGNAWAALAQTHVATGDRAQASAILRQAETQKLATFDKARIDFDAASLSGDRPAILTTMRKLYQYSPGDLELGQVLAGDESAAGNFSQSAAIWKRQTLNWPADIHAWNQLGYTLGWSGDYPGAIAALQEYVRLRPNDPNPLDSEGDVHYWFGKYSEAAASYSAAFAKSPTFLSGGDLYKAAWARYLAGDKAGADALFGQFRQLREKANDPVIVLLAGDWLYRTGREKEAFALLRGAAGQEIAAKQPALRSLIDGQLAVWDLLAGDRAAAARDASGMGNNLTQAGLLIRFSALPTASAADWQTRAEHILATPQVSGIRPAALGYALILDGKKQAAIPVWESIVGASPATEFFSRAILARLKGQPVTHAAPPDPANLNQFAALLSKL